MSDFKQGKISFKQSMYLALTVLCIYYPITIVTNIPLRHWKVLQLLAFPAIVHFIFYALLILSIDRIIDRAEKFFGSEILELKLRTIVLSILVAFIAVLVSTFLFRVSFNAVRAVMQFLEQDAIRNLGPSPIWASLNRANFGLTLVISLSIFYLIVNRKSHFRMRAMQVQTEQLIKENAVAQFQALKNQVSPHFLFNSLSILSSLVHTDPQLSEKFIAQLSKAYRYILEQKDNETVSLKTELDFLNSYSFLLKIRFERKFDVKIFVDEKDAEKYQIAPLTLQLLVENCVKHNRMSEQEPLIVTLSIKDHFLVVTNPIRPRSEAERVASTGIGLTNIMNRYRLLVNKSIAITTENNMFTVKIPMI